MNNIPSKYAGKCIAIFNNKVIAVGKNTLDVYNKTKLIHSLADVSFMCVPRKDEVVTFL